MTNLREVIAQTDKHIAEFETQFGKLEVVRLDDKKKTGRPLKLTEARFRRMLALIREGNTNSAACRIEGITFNLAKSHSAQAGMADRVGGSREDLR
jgi:hypothetical protein